MPLLTIVFTDVVESSATKRDVSLGRDSRERDHAYLEKVQTRHFDLVRLSCREFGGKEVSTMGDAFYLTFEDPVEAVRCAVDIQRRLEASPIETPRGPLRLRIGIHSGFPEFFEGSWHGTDVDTAARVEATATERQVLLSSRTYELVRQMTDVRFHPRGEFALKGVDRMALWEADWDGKGPRPTAVRPLGEIKRKRALRRVALAAVALILVGVAAGYLLRHFAPSKQNAPFVYSNPPRKSVAVLAFKNEGNPEEDWVGNAAPEILNTELAAGSGPRVIPGEDVAKAATDLPMSRMGSYGKATLTKLRNILKSDYVVAGSFLASGSQKSDPVRLDFRLQDTSSGETVASFSESGNIGTLADLLKQAGSEVRAILKFPAPSDLEATQAQATMTSNPEAFRLYTDGLAKLRAFDALNARDPLERAIALDPNWAAPHSALANAWQLLGYDSKAIDQAKKAVQLSKNLSYVDASSIEARYRELNSEWDKAIELYRSLWIIVKDDPTYALDLARVQTAAGKGQDALATLQDLENKLQLKDDPSINLARAFAADSMSDFNLQHKSASSAAEKAAALGSRYLAALAYWQDCGALYNLGDYANAEKACNMSMQSAPFSEEVKARSGTGLANILEAEGRMNEALDMRRQTLDTARNIGSQKDIIGALQNLADLLESRGEEKEAKEHYEEAIKIAATIGDKPAQVKLQNNLAAALTSDGDYTGAAILYQRALDTAREISDTPGYAMALESLGYIQTQLGHLTEAENGIREAINLQRQAGLQSNLPASLDMLGDVLMAKGDLQGARSSYEESLSLSSAQKAPAAIAYSRAELAVLEIEEGNASNAESLSRQAANEFADEKLIDPEADARNTLARALLKEGELQEAQAEIGRALSLSPRDPSVRLELGVTDARVKSRGGKAPEARKELEANLAEASKMHLVGSELEIRLAQAETGAISNPASTRTALAAVESNAREQGYSLIASEAEAQIKELPH